MRPLLVIEQEWRLAGLGLLGHRLDAAGIPYRRFRAWEHPFEEIDLGDYSGIVPLGGSAHAWDDEGYPYLRHERRLLAEAVDGDRPVLAICLGAQLLARVLGADVRETGRHEVGWQEIRPVEEALDDPLLGHVSGPVGVYQWHMDAFELPAGASRLAESGMFPNQAFRYGSAWGVQFHPEVDYAIFRVWLANHPGICEQLGIDEPGLDAAVREGSIRDLGWRSALFDRFAALVAARETPGS